MTKQFRIGPLFFSLDYPEEIQPPENFMLFETEEEGAPFHYQIRTVDKFSQPTGDLITRREDLAIFREGNLEKRIIGMKGSGYFYARYEEEDENHVLISALPAPEKWQDFYSVDTVFNSLLALERRLIALDAMILHCSYTSYKGEAILFSAPSETGKSTQSRLWEEYRGSGTVNGDRGLLRRVTDDEGGITWTAGGFPVCGSSEICHRETMPIKAIVMLRQAPENSVQRLKGMAAFREVFSQITTNSWNGDAVNRIMNQVEQLITEVPIYQLACNISEDAVACLERALYGEDAL